jgi:outer membrane protein TolC
MNKLLHALGFGSGGGVFRAKPRPPRPLDPAGCRDAGHQESSAGAGGPTELPGIPTGGDGSALGILSNARGRLTGSQANPQARIGAGYLSACRVCGTAFAQGITLSQLITDSGRTRNLVASSRLQAQASSQTYQATRYDVLLRVNQAYFQALQAQALVKVANETVAARQLTGGPGDLAGAE